MKKHKILAILITFIVVIGIAIYFGSNYIELKKIDNENKIEIIKEKNKQRIGNEESSTYIDTNPIKIGLYIARNGAKELVTEEYYTSFKAEGIMGIFYAVATGDEKISSSKYSTVWNEYWKKYNDYEKYKIGYNISFKMKDGTNVDQIILNPDDAYLMYPEIQFYLYDDINLKPGQRYYHVTKETVTDKTIYSSIKLVGDTETVNIDGDIALEVFTYDGKEDFDPNTGKYRGNSRYSITIKNNGK